MIILPGIMKNFLVSKFDIVGRILSIVGPKVQRSEPVPRKILQPSWPKLFITLENAVEHISSVPHRRS